jgi:hypothetical protein
MHSNGTASTLSAMTDINGLRAVDRNLYGYRTVREEALSRLSERGRLLNAINKHSILVLNIVG